MKKELQDILSRVDHTLLSQTATWAEIRTICDAEEADSSAEMNAIAHPDFEFF